MKSRKQKAESRNAEPRIPSSGFGFRPSFGLRISAFGFLPALALVLQPARLLACAACYGQSDSALAKGMNWGILSLLAVVLMVLAAISSFFVFIARKQSALNAPTSDHATRNTQHALHE